MTEGPSDRSEAGTTLIEVIVAVAIMGFAMVAILGGIGTSIIFTDIQRREATAGLVLTSTAEELVAETTPYEVCAEPSDYQATVTSPEPAVFEVTVTRVRFWDAASTRFVPSLDSCTPSGDPLLPEADNGLQLLDLSVTATSGSRKSTTDLQVVKRDVET